MVSFTLSLLPLYLLGNFHCLGMCGPLVMMIGHFKERLWYFLGRTASFTIAGAIAGELGSVLGVILKEYSIPAFSSFLFAVMMTVFAIKEFFNVNIRIPIQKKRGSFFPYLTTLLLKDQKWSTFLFGFCTIFLPCGQTIVVFSACALHGDFTTGLLNGLLFALCTSPSLFISMQAHRFLKASKQHYRKVLACTALLIASLSFLRALAEWEVIPHFILNPSAPESLHIVVF